MDPHSQSHSAIDPFASRRTRGTAADEWRTIPPTAKVRHKKRPPPLALHSSAYYRSTTAPTPTPSSSTFAFTPTSASAVYTPGPPDTAATGWSFASSAPSACSPAPLSHSARASFYATPAFQHSPAAELVDIPVVPVYAAPKSTMSSSSSSPSSPEPEPSSAPSAATSAPPSSSSSAPIPIPAPPPPPDDPHAHLARTPWALAEYLHLVSAVCVCAREGPGAFSWERVADAVNDSIRGGVGVEGVGAGVQGYGQSGKAEGQGGEVTRRSAWDCWHRWSVPWAAAGDGAGDRTRSSSNKNANEGGGGGEEKEPEGSGDGTSTSTYAHAPGVQHAYRALDVRPLLELYGALTRVLTVTLADPSQLLAVPDAVAPVPATPALAPPVHVTAPAAATAPTASTLGSGAPQAQIRKPTARARHPDYPPRSALPRVPPRTFGNAEQWGLSPWFHMSAVNAAALRRVVEAASVPVPVGDVGESVDAAAGLEGSCPATPEALRPNAPGVSRAATPGGKLRSSPLGGSRPATPAGLRSTAPITSRSTAPITSRSTAPTPSRSTTHTTSRPTAPVTSRPTPTGGSRPAPPSRAPPPSHSTPHAPPTTRARAPIPGRTGPGAARAGVVHAKPYANFNSYTHPNYGSGSGSGFISNPGSNSGFDSGFRAGAGAGAGGGPASTAGQGQGWRRERALPRHLRELRVPPPPKAPYVARLVGVEA
ncbi:hypothetical protein DENSPDRAFT_836652 [Dentipellis sp. KUC8613]|nr:hypothetical protein DENSPDRAFT_836652 [Dentipellis sp. KUC8613]